MGELDIFFLNNESTSGIVEDLISFPVSGVPEFWHPMSGSMAPSPRYDVAADETVVPIRLEPFQSVFVVFDAEYEFDGHATRPDPLFFFDMQDGSAIERIDDWSISRIESAFPGGNAVQTKPLAGLGDWNDAGGWSDFCGVVVYQARVRLENVPHCTYVLNLGEVGEIARVRVNGHALPPLLCPPYKVELPRQYLTVDSTVEVEVTNTLGARIRAGGRDTPAPSGLVGPVTIECFRAKGPPHR